MELKYVKRIMQSQDTVKIVRDTLCRVDERLLHHGERVAYILLKMLSDSTKYTQMQIGEICILGMFHDIGAYKTDEIDLMVQFETDNVWDHSIYGYLFLKHMSPMGKRGEAVLYHHYDYEKLKNVESDYKDIALMINLADRIDILTQGHKGELSIEMIKPHSGKKFDPEHVELFIKANVKYDIIGGLKRGEYMDEVAKNVESMIFTEREIDQYLRMLAYSIDFRSEYTVMHTINTVAFGVEIARKMGCVKEELGKIYFGALLHDIGKISIPLEILEYPGKLSNQAMTIMRTHVEITEEIIAGIVDDDICQIAIRHHEKIDGTGYPYGLKGDELTESQRIVAIADVISALIGKRSYKEAFPKEKILTILAQMSKDGKICPKVCQVVIDSYDEISLNAGKRSGKVLTTYTCMMEEFKELHDEWATK